jgi:hypothetical protein
VHLIPLWWAQLWPNMFAISVWTTLLIGWHHWSLRKHLERTEHRLRDRLDRHHAEHLAALGMRHRKDVPPE